MVLPVGSLSTLLVEEAQKHPSITFHWNHRVSGVSQDDGKAWVEVEEQPSGKTKSMHADFIIGCDGGSSAVRKALSGGSFPGYTWPKTLVAVNVSMILERECVSQCPPSTPIDP